MNCLEFRRQLLAEPQARSAELAEHRLACAACAEFASRLQGFEQVLKEAARVVVPEGLASRIILRQRMALRQQSFWRRGLFALAATVVLTLGVLLVLPQQAPLSLEESVLAHVNDELKHLAEHHDVSLDKVNSGMKNYGAQLTAAVAKVNFAMPCDMRKSKGYHMVLQGETGPVTVLIMPGDYIEQRKMVADQRFQGVIVPTTNGSMAIVAETSRDLTHVEQRLKDSLQFIS
jgi:Protein of unknown function (DUF3379)